jgi:hypothetical protein
MLEFRIGSDGIPYAVELLASIHQGTASCRTQCIPKRGDDDAGAHHFRNRSYF